MTFLRVALAALALATAGTAQAQSVPDVVRQFGLLGTWALDCGKPASPENSWSTYVASGDKVLRKDDRGSGGDKAVDMLVRTAKLLAPDLLQVQERGADMPPDLAATWETTVVLRKESANRFRIWKSSMGGKTTVDNGKVVSGGGDTWAMSRCR